MSLVDERLPAGVALRPLDRHSDDRGDLVEVFRRSWRLEADPVQWNLVRSRAGSLRGVHVHARHADYLLAVSGTLQLALKDIRPDSPSFGLGCELELSGEVPTGVVIPPGVAHGFHFPADTTYLYSVTAYWDLSDELGCAWNDPALGFGWKVADGVRLSERDRAAGSYDDMVRAWSAEVTQPAGHG